MLKVTMPDLEGGDMFVTSNCLSAVLSFCNKFGEVNTVLSVISFILATDLMIWESNTGLVAEIRSFHKIWYDDWSCSLTCLNEQHMMMRKMVINTKLYMHKHYWDNYARLTLLALTKNVVPQPTKVPSHNFLEQNYWWKFV